MNIIQNIANNTFKVMNSFLVKIKLFLLIIVMTYATNFYGINSDSLTCHFYTETDSLFHKIDKNTNVIEFYISGTLISERKDQINNLLVQKKGIYNIFVNVENENKLLIKLKTSPMFDAHYLRIIIENQLGVKLVNVNNTDYTWDEFEKSYLISNQNQK